MGIYHLTFKVRPEDGCVILLCAGLRGSPPLYSKEIPLFIRNFCDVSELAEENEVGLTAAELFNTIASAEAAAGYALVRIDGETLVASMDIDEPKPKFSIFKPTRAFTPVELEARWYKLLHKLCAALSLPLTRDPQTIAAAFTERGLRLELEQSDLEATVSGEIRDSVSQKVLFAAQPKKLKYGYSAAKMKNLIEEVTRELDYIKQRTHGCPKCSLPNQPAFEFTGYIVINPDCPACGGRGRIL